MTRDPSGPLPPYFGISPDKAQAELGSVTTTAGFGDIAAACARGRADLTGRGLDERGERRLRRVHYTGYFEDDVQDDPRR